MKLTGSRRFLRMSCQPIVIRGFMGLLTIIEEERADCVPEIEAFPNTIRLIRVPPGDTDYEQL